MPMYLDDPGHIASRSIVVVLVVPAVAGEVVALRCPMFRSISGLAPARGAIT